MLAFQTLLKIYSYISPVIDVAIIAFILYKVYELLIKTNAIQILRSAAIIALFYLGAWILKLDTLLWILNIMTVM